MSECIDQSIGVVDDIDQREPEEVPRRRCHCCEGAMPEDMGEWIIGVDLGRVRGGPLDGLEVGLLALYCSRDCEEEAARAMVRR